MVVGEWFRLGYAAGFGESWITALTGIGRKDTGGMHDCVDREAAPSAEWRTSLTADRQRSLPASLVSYGLCPLGFCCASPW
jgi:hypothetical protein